MADGTTTPVLCRVPQWVKLWLEEEARKEDRSLNKQIVHVLKSVAQHGQVGTGKDKSYER